MGLKASAGRLTAGCYCDCIQYMPGADLRQGRDATLPAAAPRGDSGACSRTIRPYSPLRERKAMTSSTRAVREPTRIVTAHRQREGAGFIVRRPVPTPGLDAVDPFLLLDEMGPADYGPGEAVGAPDHPHRGFETITYMLEGEFEHEDSAGHRGVLRPGDVQWMTAGAGIVHSARPWARMP